MLASTEPAIAGAVGDGGAATSGSVAARRHQVARVGQVETTGRAAALVAVTPTFVGVGWRYRREE